LIELLCGTGFVLRSNLGGTLISQKKLIENRGHPQIKQNQIGVEGHLAVGQHSDQYVASNTKTSHERQPSVFLNGDIAKKSPK
jgi:hypothetical protein